MRLLKTVRQKFLTIKRKSKKQYFLSGGPFNNESVWLSPHSKNTLSFTAKGMSGRYTQGDRNTELKWESQWVI